MNQPTTGHLFAPPADDEAARIAADATVAYCRCGAIVALGVTEGMDPQFRRSLNTIAARGGRVAHMTVGEARKLHMARCTCRK